ncbi:DUF1810 domain-containing protein [Aureimonas phyllosphaerae]|uniref:Uncharacterized protein (DUF1810 family) n=1 Tax=Aureimonas phyllosphaerae TaxID=1166078 RepID=A0A7W6BYQ0_9HYPH|nr:DUF1810 domain-containing protein [Aureimonas phyllosphaerae]MBB3936131.1 uncharacterized protein (DUF1810 family) [Aureimonas phyllosphaerae]MBB3960144.1 uncharacterized protein (DUF1810 family) [Aureimonas phyllosphaerae]SFF33702.1 Uncharacterized protein, DUF1810 family [Aureimonas phyllosphaerae]
MDDPHNLQRFLDAQAPVIETVESELRDGRKRSHWMWFVFPQIDGLGRSPTARHFAIRSLAEAEAFLAHPVLGARLRRLTDLVNRHHGRSALDVFGPPDDMKFHSSMTLFARASGGEAVFTEAMAGFFAGREDLATIAILDGRAGPG